MYTSSSNNSYNPPALLTKDVGLTSGSTASNLQCCEVIQLCVPCWDFSSVPLTVYSPCFPFSLSGACLISLWTDRTQLPWGDQWRNEVNLFWSSIWWVLWLICAKAGAVWGQDCPGGGRITIPGGVPVPWRCGTEGCEHGEGGLGLDLVILEVFSNLNDSMILTRFDCRHLLLFPKTQSCLLSLILTGRCSVMILNFF